MHNIEPHGGSGFSPTDSSPPLLVLFDDACSLCNASARFVQSRRRSRPFRLLPLRSEEGRALLRRHGLPEDIQSVVVLDGPRALTRSAASLALLRLLRWPWPLLYTLVLVPPPLRNAFYDLLARNRRPPSP